MENVRVPRDAFEAEIMRAYIEGRISWRNLEWSVSTEHDAGIWRLAVMRLYHKRTGFGPAIRGDVWLEDYEGRPQIWWRFGTETNTADMPPVLSLL